MGVRVPLGVRRGTAGGTWENKETFVKHWQMYVNLLLRIRSFKPNWVQVLLLLNRKQATYFYFQHIDIKTGLLMSAISRQNVVD